MAILSAIDAEDAPEGPITVGYDLATAYDEPLVVLYVLPEDQYDDHQAERTELPEQVRPQRFTLDRAIESATQRVSRLLNQTLESYDRSQVDPIGCVGDPAEEIDPRYLVGGGRKRSPTRQALFGSVSKAVMRDVSRPVVTIGTPE